MLKCNSHPILSIVLILFIIHSCSPGKKVTHNCTLIKNENEAFTLRVAYTEDYIKEYTPIEKIGASDENTHETVLLYYKNGWTYIFDAGDVTVKSWGHYNDDEFKLRAKELNIEGYQVMDVHDFWDKI